MTFQIEFPDFDPATMPTIPQGFDDVSWGNDTCPSFLNEIAGLIIFVDYADAAKREYAETPRFSLSIYDNGNTGEYVVASDDWRAIEIAVFEYQFKPVRQSVKQGLAAMCSRLADDAAQRSFLGKAYADLVGYDPFADDVAATVESVADLYVDVLVEHWKAYAGFDE